MIDFTGLVNFESKALNAAATGSAGVDVVAVTNANAMNVTGSDEATLIANFLALTNPTAGNDNAFDNNLSVGDLVVVNGNDSNAYIFRVTAVNADVDISGAQLVGVLTGVNAAQLVPGNFS